MNSEAAEFFRQYVKYFTINVFFFLALSNRVLASFQFSIKLSVTTLPRCYSLISGATVQEDSVYKHTPTLLFPHGNFCISNWLQIIFFLLLLK